MINNSWPEAIGDAQPLATHVLKTLAPASVSQRPGGCQGQPSNCGRVRLLAGEPGDGRAATRLPIHTKRAAISRFASRVFCDSSPLIHWELGGGGGGVGSVIRKHTQCVSAERTTVLTN